MKKFAGLLYAVAGLILTNGSHAMLSNITKNAITIKGYKVPFLAGTRQFRSTKKYLPIVESVIDEIRAKDAAQKRAEREEQLKEEQRIANLPQNNKRRVEIVREDGQHESVGMIDKAFLDCIFAKAPTDPRMVTQMLKQENFDCNYLRPLFPNIDFSQIVPGSGRFYFLTGTMGAGKTEIGLNFIASLGRPLYNDGESGASCMENDGVWILQSKLVGDKVRSRNGLWTPANEVFDDESDFERLGIPCLGIKVIVVEEAQFLTPLQVLQLRRLANEGITVVCCGIDDDFRKKPFQGSAAINDVYNWKVILSRLCENCGENVATVNARFMDGLVVKEGGQILTGQSFYHALCNDCWNLPDLMIEDAKINKKVK